MKEEKFRKMKDYELQTMINKAEKAPEKLKKASTLSMGILSSFTNATSGAGAATLVIAAKNDMPALKKAGWLLIYSAAAIGLINLGVQGALIYIEKRTADKQLKIKEELARRKWRAKQNAMEGSVMENAESILSKIIEQNADKNDFVNEEDGYSESGIESEIDY